MQPFPEQFHLREKDDKEKCDERKQSMSRLLGCVSAGSWAIGSNNLREVDKNNSDCEAIVERCGPAFFAEVENTKCAPFENQNIHLDPFFKGFSIETSITNAPFTCASNGTYQTCHRLWSRSDMQRTYLLHSKKANIGFTNEVVSQKLGNTQNPKTVIRNSQNGEILHTFNAGEGFRKLKFRHIWESIGITENDLNFDETFGNTQLPYGAIGATIKANAQVRNLRRFSFDMEIVVDLTFELVGNAWGDFSVDTIWTDIHGKEGIEVHRYGLIVYITTTGSLGYFDIQTLLSNLTNSLVLLGLVATIINIYLKRVHSYIDPNFDPEQLTLIYEKLKQDDFEDEDDLEGGVDIEVNKLDVKTLDPHPSAVNFREVNTAAAGLGLDSKKRQKEANQAAEADRQAPPILEVNSDRTNRRRKACARESDQPISVFI